MLIGTTNCVIKCRIVDRFDETDRWNNDRVLEMKGTPWELVPGRPGQHIFVDVVDGGEYLGVESENEEVQDQRVDEADHEQEFKGGMDKFHVSRKAIKEFGETVGCPACDVIRIRGDRPGRVGKHHSGECRKRILEMMHNDPRYRHLAERYKSRIDGGENNVGGSVDNVTANNLQQLTIGEHVSKNKPTKMEFTTGECTEMCTNVKKAITQIKENIRMEKERLLLQSGNLGTQLNQAMLKMLVNQMQVAEVYSPPRVVEMANRMGMRGGWSLDLTICDPDGSPWDFNSIKMRNRAIEKWLNDRPFVLIGSPMCTAYSAMNRINYCRLAPDEVAQRLAYAKKRLEFCIRLYEIQWESGRYFLHEHPHDARSWQEDMMKILMRRQGVQRVVGDQCQFGFKSKDEEGVAPAKKRTSFFTNAVCIAKRLNKRCPNTREHQVHRHVMLTNGRARVAQVYPDRLCREICLGIQEQMQRDRQGQYLLANIESERETTSKELMKEVGKLKERYQTVEEEEDINDEEVWGDVSGAPFDPQEIKRARREEIEYVRKTNLYEKVPISEAYQQTGKAPISVRWIDIDKGDKESPNYRSRLVAREINTSKRNNLFAAIPPLEALKLVLSFATS